MGEREFTLFRFDVTLGDLGSDDAEASHDDADAEADEDDAGRSTARLAALAFVAAGTAGAAAVAYLRFGGDDDDGGDAEYDETDAFGAESVAADLDAETDRRLDRVRGAFPARVGGADGERPDAGAGASTLVGLGFLMAAAAAARYLAEGDEAAPRIGTEPESDARTEGEAVASTAST